MGALIMVPEYHLKLRDEDRATRRAGREILKGIKYRPRAGVGLDGPLPPPKDPHPPLRDTGMMFRSLSVQRESPRRYRWRKRELAGIKWVPHQYFVMPMGRRAGDRNTRNMAVAAILASGKYMAPRRWIGATPDDEAKVQWVLDRYLRPDLLGLMEERPATAAEARERMTASANAVKLMGHA